MLLFTLVQLTGTWCSSGRLCVKPRWLLFVGNFNICINTFVLLLLFVGSLCICAAFFSFNFYYLLQFTVIQLPGAIVHGGAVEASHLYGSHLLGGQFWSAPVENPREMSSDCQNLGEAAAFALLRLSHQVFAKNNCRGSSVAPQRQGSNQGLCSVSSFYSFTLPASLCTTFDRNNCRLIML